MADTAVEHHASGDDPNRRDFIHINGSHRKHHDEHLHERERQNETPVEYGTVLFRLRPG